MDNALVRNHIQPLGFALVLYVVTALVHYTPYSPGRGGLTITIYILDNMYTLIPSHTGSRAQRQVELVAVNGYILAQHLSVRL